MAINEAPNQKRKEANKGLKRSIRSSRLYNLKEIEGESEAQRRENGLARMFHRLPRDLSVKPMWESE